MRAAWRDRSVVVSALVVLTCLVLGLLAGGMLLIGVSFVSFWKSLSPSDFQAWFASHSHLIGRLMIPLGAGGVVVTVDLRAQVIDEMHIAIANSPWLR